MPNETPPVPASIGEALGGFFGPLRHIPGALGAIGRLVGKTAELGEKWLDIPAAEAERRAQAVRDDKDARSIAMKMLGEAVGTQAVADHALLGRAMSSFVDDRLRKQTNREEVARKAIDSLDEKQPAPDVIGPAEDWMNVFEAHAERANSEELRSLWGRVLAGEIRHRGAYSLRSLQFISLLDQNLAALVDKIGGFIVNESVIPDLIYFRRSPGLDELLTVADLGLVATDKSSEVSVPTSGPAHMKLGSDRVIRFTAIGNKQYRIAGAIITHLGKEIFPLVNARASEAIIECFDAEVRPLIEPDAYIIPTGTIVRFV